MEILVDIGDFMTSPVLRIEADKSVADAAKIMEEKYVGSLIVSEGGKDVGILTDRDLGGKVISKGKDANQIKISEVMTTPVLTMDKYLPVEQANSFMQKNKIRHLGVTEADKIVGVLSIKDLVSYYSQNFKVVEGG